MSVRRVLHVVEGLDRGSVEQWLLRMLRHSRRLGVDVDWTFYSTVVPSTIGDEAAALGARVVDSPVAVGDKLAFVRSLRRELIRGEYDVLHCHHDLVSAVYLAAAFGLPLRKRLVHVHNADESTLTPNPLKQAVLRPLMRRACRAMADGTIANSNHSMDTFLSGAARRGGRDVVHHYGIDADRFVGLSRDRTGLRRQLGLPDDSRLLLFAGRLVHEKNPLFALDVLTELRRLDGSVAGVFVGSGSLTDELCRRAAERGLDSSFRFLGWRNDVAEIMGCCDCFVLPHPEHPMEGFGMAVVEAQLAGLPLLLSNGIADDPLLPTALFRRLALAAGPLVWARAALDLLKAPSSSPPAVFENFRQSPMDMNRALRDLIRLHG